MKKKQSICILCAFIVLDAVGFYFSIKDRGANIFTYYTQLSNLFAAFSAGAYILTYIKGELEWVTNLRYASSCMLLLTSLITIILIAPSGEVPLKKLLFSPLDNGLYHHLLCPILSIFSYLCFEPHIKRRKGLLLPVSITVAYGAAMIVLNLLRIVDGPYPFLRVYSQSIAASVIWFCALLAVIFLLSEILFLLGNKFTKRTINNR